MGDGVGWGWSELGGREGKGGFGFWGPVCAQASMSAPEVMIGMAYFWVSDGMFGKGRGTWTGVGMTYRASLTFSSITE